MKRFLRLLRFDTVFLGKQGILPLYLIVTALFVGIMLMIPKQQREIALPFFYLSDPCFLGFFFIGGVLYFESEQRTLEAVFVTPVRVSEYLISKSAVFGLISVILTLALLLTTEKPALSWVYPLTGITAASSVFTLLGISFSALTGNISKYLLFGGLLEAPALLPLLDHFGIAESRWFYLLPSQGALSLLRKGIGYTVPVSEILLSYISLLLWNVLLYFLAERLMKNTIIQKTGESR